MRIVVGLLLVWLAVGSIVAIFDAAFEGDDGPAYHPSYYPDCSEIVRQPGTYHDAKCVSLDEVIEVDTYPLWDNYHPGQ